MMIRPTSPATMVAGRVARSSRVRPAFTLVEVIVVMVILVIIAGAATVGVTKYLDTAKRQEAKLKMQKIENAAKTYLAVYNEYPTDPSQLVTQSPDGSAPLIEGGQTAVLDPWGVPFQMSIVQDDQGSTRVRIVSTGSGTQIAWPEK